MERELEEHILVLPYPVQGHINPMLQFAKRLSSKGVKVTLLDISRNPLVSQLDSNITITTIPDGFQEGEMDKLSIDEVIRRRETQVSKTLTEFIQEEQTSKTPPKTLVYDAIIPWALTVAQNLGLEGAAFFTQPWAVNAIYYYFHQGFFKIPLEEKDGSLSLPSMPVLGFNDLPSFVRDSTSFIALAKIHLSQFSNLKQAKWLFCNSFDKLEKEVVEWMEKEWPIKNIGPTIPSMFLDKRLEDDKDYGLSLFHPNIDICMKWLDSRERRSVVYASFGSLATLGEDQMREFALGLKNSGCFFLWVVKNTEITKLPNNYTEEISDQGLIVNWTPQLEVLAHKSVGCFITHCGWNSTIEAMSMGVPMVGMPQVFDQPTNAKFLEDVWKVGIRVKPDGKGVITKEEIERCVKGIMEGDKGNEIRKNSDKWKELAREAVYEGGSSDKNICDFIAKLASI